MHDARMLAVSDLYDDLENFAFCPAGREMCLYGDPAYPLRIHLQAPFRVGVLTRQMEIFNEKMSAVRASVEWLFADIINYFKFLDFKKNLRIGLSQVGKMYIVCAILRNALTCLSWKALDNIDLNLVSHRYVSGVVKDDHFVSAHSLAPRF